MNSKSKVQYPYIPVGRTIKYVGFENVFMKKAYEIAKKYKGNLLQPNGVVLVKNGVIIGLGSIGMGYHYKNGCERIKHNMPTGVGYDLCPGCSIENHGERMAIKNAKENGFDPVGSDVYLWGHWWCCKDCWEVIIEAGIENVYLLEKSEILFNKNHPDNIVGHQFEYFENMG